MNNTATGGQTDTGLTSSQVSLTVSMQPDDTRTVAVLCGECNQNLKHIEQQLDVQISNRGGTFSIQGEEGPSEQTASLLQRLYDAAGRGKDISASTIQLYIKDEPNSVNQPESASSSNGQNNNKTSIRTKTAPIKPRGKHQQQYTSAITSHDINFGIGPAGTGKTYLAVACAVEALLTDKVERLLLVRPAVEAGEKLGFLPGDLTQKIDPYLRPLYDALYEMLGFETVGRLLEKQVIEVAPLAYMRGRTLNNAFIILDESQNTTRAQMKMFLTRIGFGSTAVITGDTTQIDLPRGTHSGLLHSCEVLKEVDGISFTYFNSSDVVRHPLVQRIVDAYEENDIHNNKQSDL